MPTVSVNRVHVYGTHTNHSKNEMKMVKALPLARREKWMAMLPLLSN